MDVANDAEWFSGLAPTLSLRLRGLRERYR
jgi:hypothetical protein